MRAMELLERLGPKAEVADAPVDLEALEAWHTRTAGSDPMQSLRRWVDGYRQRHREGRRQASGFQT